MSLPPPSVVLAGALRACAALGLALTVATCRDALGPGHTALGRVAVAPVFPSEAALGEFGLTIDAVRFIVVRRPADTIADTTLALPPDATALELDLRVRLIAIPETLSVSVVALSGTVPLFAGTSLVPVPSRLPPTVIPLTSYVGPVADSIVIQPRDPFILVNDELRFQVQGFNGGVPVTQFYVAWSTSDTAVAAINSFGVLRAPGARSAVRVRARTPSGAGDSVTATFVPLPTQLVLAGGAGQSGIVGQTLQVPLEVEVRGSDNLPVGGVAVRFRSLSGGAPADTTVVSDAAGRARVIAVLGTTAGAQSLETSLPGFPGIAAVTFGARAIAGQISAVTSLITVSAGTVLSGADVLLTLQGKDAAGNDVATGGAAVVFTASGGTSTGTIGATTDASDGMYTATFTGITAGTATTIGALIDDVAVTSTPLPTITVLTGAIASVVVSPGSALLGALNATQQFGAVAFDGKGNPVATTFAWSSSDPLVASVDGTGLATALATGAVTIAASSGGVADSADLTVQQVVASVAVTPDKVLLTAVGETVQLTAAARDSRGSAVSGATFTWATSNDLAATVDATGLVTAVADGTAEISATTAGVVGTAQMTVNLLGAATQLVFIQQPPSPVFFGEPFSVQVAAQDDLNNTVTGFTGLVTVSENAISQNAASTLQGTVQVAAVNGVATFSDLSVNGTDTTALDASADVLTGTSNIFHVVNQIVVGTGAAPYFAGVDTVTDRIYVSNTAGRSASVFDGATRKGVATITGLGSNPRWEGVNPATKQVFISDFVEGTVYVIDESQEAVVATIPVGANATQPAVNTESDLIYVPARPEALSLVIVDMATRKEVGAVAIGGTSDNAGGAVWDPATRLVWVVVETQGSVISVDPANLKVVDAITVGGAPYGIALDSKLNRLYVTLSLQNQVAVIDLIEKVTLQPIAAGRFPQGLSVDSETGRVFVANRDDGTISVIDGGRGELIRTIIVGSGPGDAEYNPRNRLVYVPNGNDNSLSIVKPD